MHMMRTFILFIFIGALRCYAQSAIYFLPCATNASVSFEGHTQAGIDTHRLEVRRLAYTLQTTKESGTTMIGCVVYFAGDEYGPSILRVMEDCITPLVTKVSKDVVEIYFSAGVHTHIRQTWRLLGWTAKLESDESIDWRCDPRMKTEATRLSTNTLTTPSYKITITVQCPEGEVTCENVKYVGVSKKTGKSITLIGKEIHTAGPDGITPPRLLGYQFKNGRTTYLVGDDGKFEVRRGSKTLIKEQGVWAEE
jgi:hypothetical protein